MVLLRLPRYGVHWFRLSLVSVSLTRVHCSGSTEDMFDPDTALDFQDKLMDTYGSVCRIKGPFGVSLRSPR
ncbi:hypothetical protein AG1IA_10105 [Rhizoctonia solani AG-1 IA]|uniref:Uncharacterized protein n=1 Tax=Thanatephorus cucumeris (strain AG1-IA) TaxID=983506 RepID=L8WD35_THACA|nr:hypothetical protein AG1IA_10105 [Rhizoctonia solani AG-1 IA]